MALERKNVPTVTFLTDAFATYGQGLAKMQGMAELPTVVIPHPIASRPNEELQAKVRGVYADILAGLLLKG